MNEPLTEHRTGHIYTVSKLTGQIKSLLEDAYPFVWVVGEISNYSVPASGHSYFILKDSHSVIQAVMFKNQKRGLKFIPENGMKVYGLARLSLYEPRGSYQLIFEHLEPEGVGSVQIAFEQLKTKLKDNGFFDEKFKKPIPFLPESVCLITSPTGAAVKDMINVSQRRFPNCCLKIIPVSVQGENAVDEICKAISLVNDYQLSDVIILARGGGSLEDLTAFNSEPVAHAIFDSKIPIISGIGHETDFTIADFIADLRAPTPSAAAELAFPEKKNLLYTVHQYEYNLSRSMGKKIQYYRQTIDHYMARIKSPERIIHDFRVKIKTHQTRLTKNMGNYQSYNKEKLKWFGDALKKQNPGYRIIQLKNRINDWTVLLNQRFKSRMDNFRFSHSRLTSTLEVLNPAAVLQRGYSIARLMDDKTVITNAKMVQKHDRVEVILHQGRLITKVEQTNG